MTKAVKRNIRKYLAGISLGVLGGLVVSYFAGNLNSQCSLLCDPKITMAYFGLVGLVVSLK